MRRIIFTALMVLFISGCGAGQPVIGSLVTREGRITDVSTVYRFKPVKNDDTVRKLFADIYFAGDTVCFSLNGMNHVDPEQVKAVYTHIPTGITMEAERIERTGDRLWGFALVGSLLEAFYRGDLTANGNAWRERGKQIPLRLTISIPGKGTTAGRDFNI